VKKHSHEFLESLVRQICTGLVIAALAGLVSYLKGLAEGELERKALDEALDFALQYYR